MNLNSNSTQMNSQDEYVDFRTLLYNLWENRLLLLLTVSITLILCFAYLLLKTPQYETNVLIQVDNKKSNSLSSLNNLIFGAATGASESGIQEALIHSRVILEPVIKQLSLDLHVQPHSSKLLGWFSSKSSENKLTINNMVVPTEYYGKPLKLTVVDAKHYRLLENNDSLLLKGEVGKSISNNKGFLVQVSEMTAKPGDQFDIIHLSTFKILNNLLDNIKVVELMDANNNPTGVIQVSFKDTDSKRLIDVLNAVANIAQTKNVEQKRLDTEKTLQFLYKQLPIVRAELEKAETAYNKYRAASGKLDIKFESQHLMQSMISIEKQITSLQLAKVDYLQRFTSEHPFLIELNGKIEELKRQKTQVENDMKALPASDQVAVNLMRDVKLKNGLYLILLNKIQDMEVLKNNTFSDVHVLAYATEPESPLSKQGVVTMLAGLVLGLILGCFIILARKAFFRHVNDPRWIEQNLNITNLAIIPFSKIQRMNVASFHSRSVSYLEILAEKSPHDLSIEALRSLRTSFQIVCAGTRNNIISITGVTQGIGKSFVSVNLAYLLADIGKKILLIDGDIRKGHLHDYFNISLKPGLNEVVNGAIEINAAIHTTKYDCLHFLSCGDYPRNPAELLMSPRFKQAIEVIANQYDLIIIDTAPVLAVTDSTLIGALAGINLLVVGSDSHQSEEISLAVKRLSQAGISVNGTIFNIIKPESSVNKNFQHAYYSNNANTLVN